MSDLILHVTDSLFEQEVLQSDKPVLVDFWADWCGPCKQIAPFLEQLAEEMKDTIKIAKLNIDDNPNTPGKYGVRGIPTLMIFSGGQIQATKIGAMPKTKLVEWVNSALS